MDEARDSPGVIAPPPLIALTALLIGLALDWFFPSFILRGVFGFATRLIIGAILIGFGAAMAILARSKFLQAGTNVEPWKPSLKLVTGGVFAWMLILLVPMAVILHFGVVKREERYLETRFGENYHAYLNRVPRYGLPMARH